MPAVDVERRRGQTGFEALRQVHLIDVAGGDVLVDARDARRVGGGVEARCVIADVPAAAAGSDARRVAGIGGGVANLLRQDRERGRVEMPAREPPARGGDGRRRAPHRRGRRRGGARRRPRRRRRQALDRVRGLVGDRRDDARRRTAPVVGRVRVARAGAIVGEHVVEAPQAARRRASRGRHAELHPRAETHRRHPLFTPGLTGVDEERPLLAGECAKERPRARDRASAARACMVVLRHKDAVPPQGAQVRARGELRRMNASVRLLERHAAGDRASPGDGARGAPVGGRARHRARRQRHLRREPMASSSPSTTSCSAGATSGSRSSTAASCRARWWRRTSPPASRSCRSPGDGFIRALAARERARRSAVGDDVFIVASVGDAGRRASSGGVTSLAAFDANWEYTLERAIFSTAMNPGPRRRAVARSRAAASPASSRST